MNAIAPAFGCTAGATSFEDALERVLRLVAGPLQAQTLPLGDCIGRVLAESFTASLDQPRFNQSAMDGYAVCSTDVTPGAMLPLTGRTAAGEAPDRLLQGSAHRILTGAPLPEGADAVIAQENVHCDGDLVHIGEVPPNGTNVRPRGEDISRGMELIPAATMLDWRHLTVLAAQGAAYLAVRRRPRVALLSSGRELCALGERLAPGQIHDSNLPMLTALLRAFGADVLPMPVVADDAASMRSALRTAARNADLVLTTAGISVGDEDHVRDALHDLGGNLTVLKVAMKPGKPLAAGRLGDAVFIGLPGNPQAALAGAFGFVRPVLALMAGIPAPAPMQVRAGFTMHRKPGRAEFILVRLIQDGFGIRADRAGPDGSGRLGPLLLATGFAFVSADQVDVRAEQPIAVIPFGGGCVVTASTGQSDKDGLTPVTGGRYGV